MTGYATRGISLSLVAVLLAATSAISTTAAQAQQQTAQRQFTFDIPAKSVTHAVNDIGRITGLSVVFRENKAITIEGKPVHGSMTAEQALASLLAGTGLSYRFSNSTTVQVFNPVAADTNGNGTAADGSTLLQTILIQGKNESAWGPVDGYIAKTSASGTKTDTPLIETTRSISVVPAKQIEDQAAQSVNEALRYTAGVRNDYYGPSTFQDQMMIRGFSSDTYVDGVAVIDGDGGYDTQVNPLTVERIEVLRGPASALYGQSRPGGMVNIISKRPTAQKYHRVQLQTGSYDRLQGVFDFSGPVTPDGELLYRLSGGGRVSGTEVDHVDDDRSFLEGGLTWRPNNTTEWTLLGKYRKDKTGALQHELPAIGTRLHSDLGRIPTSRFVGEPDWNDYDRDTTSLTSLFSHQINDIWTFRQNMRVSHTDLDMKDISLSSHLGEGIVDRYASRLVRKKTSFGSDQHFEADFDTGKLTHKALFGIDYRYSKLMNKGGYEYLDGVFDLYNPVYGAAIPDILFNTEKTERLHQLGIYAQDQIKVDGFLLNFGIRQDWSKSDTLDHLTDETVEQRDHAMTWNANIGYLFNNGIMTYFSYSQSFEPQVGSGYDGEPFKPTEGKQYEVGVKYQPQGSNLLLTASAYNLDQENVTTTDVEHQCNNWDDSRCGYYSEQTGKVRSKGIELEGRWSVTPSLDLIAAYSYIHTETLSTNTAANLGKELRFLPNHQASLWANYEFQDGPLEGLTIGGGARYIGTSYGNNSNTIKNDSYILADAAISYDFSKKWQNLDGLKLSVNATNLFDKIYISSCTSLSESSAGCYYGSRRKVLANLSYEW